MRIAKVIGNVVLSRSHPSYDGANLKLAVPYTFDNLDETSDEEADTVVVWDQLGTNSDTLIAMAEGPEAAQPFRPEIKPVDAYAASILDSIDLHEASMIKLRKTK
jgi:microcompartment protein CcmK/EutM